MSLMTAFEKLKKLPHQRWFRAFFYPSAFKMGLIVTVAFCYVAHEHYTLIRTHRSAEHSFFNLIEVLHQKSVDWRMKNRGERPGTDKIALVAIDEHSLEKMGRWPWSREKIARIVDELVKNGVKAVGFDVIFSESETNSAIETLEAIRSSGPLPAPIRERLDQELQNADKDKILAETIKAHSPKLVMGAYYEAPTDQYYPFQEACGEVLVQNRSDYLAITKQSQPIADLDENPLVLPEGLRELISVVFQLIEEQTRESFGKVNSPSDELDLSRKIEGSKESYCDRFLTAKDEHLPIYAEAWPEIAAKESELKGFTFEQWLDLFRDERALRNPVQRTGRWWTNIAKLGQHTSLTGFFNAFLDTDGTIRRTRLFARYGGRYLPSLPFQLYLAEKGTGGTPATALVSLARNPSDLSSKMVNELSINDGEGERLTQIPVDEEGRLTVNYAGPRYMFPHVSAYDLVNGRPTISVGQRINGSISERTVNKNDFFKDKLVIIGATAVGIFDLRVTPFDENFPGLEIHANVLDNLIRSDFMLSPSDELFKMPLFLLLLGVFLSLLLKHIGAVAGLATTFAVSAILLWFDRNFLFGKGVIVAILLPLLMVISIYVFITFYKYLTEERKKRALKGTFQKYVSPSIVNEILKDPSNIELGGKKLRMSVMFSDVRGFTTISEKLDPQVLTKILNTYLTPMTKLVFDNKGTLDKYMGDAIMAFFGAPITYSDHAQHACRCALQMMEKLKEIQSDFKKRNLPEIDIGIGINTGDMSVGNMGSDIVRSYTVMGDSVNLGSRLEGINKEYGTHIIVSEFTYEDIKDNFVCREVDRVRVKGKRLPVRIFELIAEGKTDPETTAVLESFNAGFQLYLQQNWAQALRHFNRALELRASDGPTALYVERCQTYLSTPPRADWDGVFEMKTK